MLHTNPLTAQEVFNIARDHLLKQNAKSAHNNAWGFQCLYRGPTGLMCAVGPFLTDEEAEVMEQFDVLSADAHRVFPERLAEHILLLAALQNVHDSHEPDEWKDLLEGVASDFDLHF